MSWFELALHTYVLHKKKTLIIYVICIIYIHSCISTVCILLSYGVMVETSNSKAPMPIGRL